MLGEQIDWIWNHTREDIDLQQSGMHQPNWRVLFGQPAGLNQFVGVVRQSFDSLFI
jgi:hypothetical protein